MPDIEKVIEELRELHGSKETMKLISDTIKLLKERETVNALADGEDSYICSDCGTVIGWAELEPDGIEEVKYKFCPECGKAVKWR